MTKPSGLTMGYEKKHRHVEVMHSEQNHDTSGMAQRLEAFAQAQIQRFVQDLLEKRRPINDKIRGYYFIATERTCRYVVTPRSTF